MPGGKILPFISKGAKTRKKEEIKDHGKLGTLSYEVFRRGVIHIFDGDLTFKKDAALFEDALDAIDFDAMADGESHTIKGSGDNDNLVFRKERGVMDILLKKRGHDKIDKLKSILSRGKKKEASNA